MAHFFSIHRVSLAITLGALLPILTACDGKPPAPAMPVPEVSVMTTAPTRFLITSELPGRLEAQRTAEIRARVAGIVLKRNFTEGSYVQAGELLYQIDPEPFAANVAAAQATLKRNIANAFATKQKSLRYQALISSNAISKQDYDDAIAAEKQTEADVLAAKASLHKAELELGYTKVTAPISGKIGRALVTEGALVGQDGATPLALIQSITPMYVLFNQSARDALRLKQTIESGKLKNINARGAVRLILEDGQEYPQTGTLLFTDITVDPSTASVALRAEFPNPDKTLLPGTFVRVRLSEAINNQALLVPQQAVMRDSQGANVLVVDKDNKVALRAVKADTAQGNQWVIQEGLVAGERIIVEGRQKARPGATVKTSPYQASR